MIKKMKQIKYTPEEVDYEFASTNSVSEENRIFIAKSLSLLDKKIVDKIVKEVHFFDGYGCYGFHIPFDTKMLKDKKSFIFLTENWKGKSEEGIKRMILHEVAHHYCGHKCLFDFPINDEKERNKYDYQEIEADKQVEEWLNRK